MSMGGSSCHRGPTTRGGSPQPSSGARSALAAGHPEDVAVLAVGVAGEDEEQVREAVEVGDREDVHRVLVLGPRRPPGPLGAAYDGACDVAVGGRGGPAVEDERPQG